MTAVRLVQPCQDSTNAADYVGYPRITHFPISPALIAFFYFLFNQDGDDNCYDYRNPHGQDHTQRPEEIPTRLSAEFAHIRPDMVGFSNQRSYCRFDSGQSFAFWDSLGCGHSLTLGVVA